MSRPLPAYTRLDVDERRRQLLELGTELFTRHAYEELTMAAIARAAGISKPLLYHYFPSKQAFFVATLERKALELAELTRTDPDAPPAEQLTASVSAFLGWVDDNAESYAKLIRSAGAVPEVRDLVDRIRDTTAERILEGLGGTGRPALRAAVHGWLWYADGVILDWLAHRDLARDQVAGLLLGTLAGAVTAAGENAVASRLDLR